MEAAAEVIASNCDDEHSGSTTDDLDPNLATFTVPSPAEDLGENLAWSSQNPPVFSDGDNGVIDLVDLWISEGRYYEYGTIDGTEVCTAQNNLNTNGCGHFTQV